MLIFSAGMILIVANLFRMPDKVTGVLLMVFPLSNTGFLGVPMIRTFFGEVGLPHLIVYDQVGTLIILISFGSLILARYGNEGKVSLPGLLRQTLSFPPMTAFVAVLESRMTPIVAASAMAVTAKMDAELAVALADPVLLFSLVTLESFF
jgi:predicted permease